MNTSILTLLIYLALSIQSLGGMLWMDQQIIEFKLNSTSLTNITWEPVEEFNVTEDGLGWDDEPACSRSVTIRFKPLPIGYSWRAPSGVGVNIKMISDQSEYTLNSGQTSKPRSGRFFVRYSVNRKDWSSWINIPQKTEDDTIDWYYDIRLGVPVIDTKEYQKYYSEFRTLDVPWVDDQDALARWITEKDTDFFAKHIPFIGWIEILYEGSIGGSRRLNEVNISVGAGIGGTHTAPKDPNNPNYHSHSPWKFYQK